MAKVLLAEDEDALANMVVDYLTAQQYLVDRAKDGGEALQMLKVYSYDLVIMDWNLPEMDGITVLRHYRSSGGESPVLMLTAKRSMDDKEEGFESGADDYLTKPFHMRELGMRLKALLRRPAPVSTDNTLRVRNIVLNPDTHIVTRDGKELDLLPKEFSLLEFFMRNPRRLFSAEAILDRVWSTDTDSSASVIRTYIQRLRSKIDSESEPSLITTVHGVGYRLDP